LSWADAVAESTATFRNIEAMRDALAAREADELTSEMVVDRGPYLSIVADPTVVHRPPPVVTWADVRRAADLIRAESAPLPPPPAPRTGDAWPLPPPARFVGEHGPELVDPDDFPPGTGRSLPPGTQIRKHQP
jgi:hypothetical protein